MHRKILVVENEDFFREAIVSILESLGYETVEAPNGKVAKELIGISNFSLVLSDIQMPFLNGLELLTWIKSERPQLPVVLMTGFAHALETEEAFKMGVDHFLTKPFAQSELVKHLNEIFGSPNEEKVVGRKEGDFCRIPIEDFLGDKQLDYDLYIKLSTDKFIKIANKEDTLYQNRFKQYKGKGLHFLYIQKTDFQKIVGFNLKLGKLVFEKRDISQEKKLGFLKYSTEIVLERAFVGDTDQEAFDNAKTLVENTLSLTLESDQSAELLKLLSEHNNRVYAHCLGVSIYGSIICKKIGWDSMSTRLKVSLAAMFHDIGKKEIPTEIINKPRSSMTAEERALYETHPTRGKEILQSLKIFPPDIPEIVYHHHEDCLGQGYPQRLRRAHIHPLARLISVANIFCNYAIENPDSPGMGGIDAIRMMEIHHKSELDSEMFNALKSAFYEK